MNGYERCGRPVRFHVRDFRKIAIRAVCEKPEHRKWGHDAILGLGYSPGEYPVTEITNGCQAPAGKGDR